MHRIDGTVVLALVLYFGPVAWAFGWVALDSWRTRRHTRTHARITQRYSNDQRDNGGDMGRHSLRDETDEGDGKDQPVARGRHALDDRDEALAWVWPSEDPDDDAATATEELPIGSRRDRADDTMPNLDLRWGVGGIRPRYHA